MLNTLVLHTPHLECNFRQVHADAQQARACRVMPGVVGTVTLPIAPTACSVLLATTVVKLLNVICALGAMTVRLTYVLLPVGTATICGGAVGTGGQKRAVGRPCRPAVRGRRCSACRPDRHVTMNLDSRHMQPSLAPCGKQIICAAAMQSPCVSPSPDLSIRESDVQDACAFCACAPFVMSGSADPLTPAPLSAGMSGGAEVGLPEPASAGFGPGAAMGAPDPPSAAFGPGAALGEPATGSAPFGPGAAMGEPDPPSAAFGPGAALGEPATGSAPFGPGAAMGEPDPPSAAFGPGAALGEPATGSAPFGPGAAMGEPDPPSAAFGPGAALGEPATGSALFGPGAAMGEPDPPSAAFGPGAALGEPATGSAPFGPGAIMGEPATGSAPLGLGAMMGRACIGAWLGSSGSGKARTRQAGRRPCEPP